MLGEGMEKREPSYTLGGNVSWCSHYNENRMESSSENMKMLNWKENPKVHRSTIYNSQDKEATQVSTNIQMNKEDVVCVCVCVYNGISVSHKKPYNAICSNMDRPRDYHTKWSK